MVTWALIVSAIGAVASVAATCVMLIDVGRTPRQWAPYLERRANEHSPLIVGAVGLAAAWLNHADRLDVSEPLPLPASLGASPARSGPDATGRLRIVGTLAELQQAVNTAQPGDVIQLLPGDYRQNGFRIGLVHPGTAQAPITLRAARLGDAVIHSDVIELFNIVAPYWQFENLVFRGEDDWCEHAIHIVAGAEHLLIRNNRFEDFNAALKINAQSGLFPDDGVIAGNTFANRKPRNTGSPITPIDLDAASDWDIRDNIITDFVRAFPGGATYGGYAKGSGAGNIFERNLVVCTWKLHGYPGAQVGLSLGGGGTGPQFMRDGGRSGIEQFHGVIRDNLIVSCGDAGIYLNRAAGSIIEHNTLLDTSGIEVRFPQSSARITANMIDGIITTRDGGNADLQDNLVSNLLGLFVGWHPVRGYFNQPVSLDLTWRDTPAGIADGGASTDLCGHHRALESRPGAFDDFSRCLAGR